MTLAPRIPYRRRPVTSEEARALLDREIALSQERRSVREFSDRPVPRELIEAALQIAITAPSGANQQPYRFVVISDPALKARIREGAEAEEREFYTRRAPQEWLDALAPLGTDENKPFLTVAPYLIVVFRQLSGAQGEKIYYPVESVGISVGFLLSALNRFGLATLTHTPAPMSFLNELCGRPKNEKPFVLIPVGYPADDATVPAITRRPLDELVVWR
jgi:iodotyrosine deiodinase